MLVEHRVILEPTLGSAGAARTVLREALAEAGRERWRDVGELALSEVATNAVLHAHTAFEVLVAVEPEQLRVEVRDYSSVVPVQRLSGEHATTGRGMALVAALTAECGVRVLSEGKLVWFVVRDEEQAVAELDEDALLEAWGLDADLGGDDDWAPPRPRTRHVVLRGLPPTLWLAARQHHDTLLRELVLHLAAHPADDVVDLVLADRARGLVTRRVLEVVEEEKQRGTPAERLPDTSTGALPWQSEPLDVEIDVATDLGPAYAALQDALDLAERLAVTGRLLARPGLPEIIAVRDWVCEQVIAQLSGVAPSAWPGTAQEEFTTRVHDRAEPASADWDVSSVRDSDRRVAAADEANRLLAVSAGLAELLGWEVDELVGRRVVTIVPPEFREAHVSGFSRFHSTGDARIFGQRIEVPVLRRDGSHLQCSLVLEHAPSSSGRAVYVAWIDPV